MHVPKKPSDEFSLGDGEILPPAVKVIPESVISPIEQSGGLAFQPMEIFFLLIMKKKAEWVNLRLDRMSYPKSLLI